MNLLPYELFVSVAHTQNISKTAEQYYLSQPAVSHHIKSLEQSLGVQLITRTKRGVTLTAEGSEYLPYIQEILSINERADSRLRNLAHGIHGQISIAALSSASFQVSQCLAKLYDAQPSIQTDVTLLEGPELQEALRENSHDFFFAVSPIPSDIPSYKRLTIEQGCLSLFVNRRDLPLIDLQDWSTVRDLPFVSVSEADASLYGQAMSVCRNRGFEPRILNIYNRAESVVLAVNSGLGVAILPDSLGRLFHRPDVVTLPIGGQDARRDTIFLWDESKLSSAGEAFRDVVLSMYKASE